MRVKYDSNNSGGHWWLEDKDWEALEKAGWEVEWGQKYFCHSTYRMPEEKQPDYLTELCPDGKSCKGHRQYQSYAEALAADARWLGSLARAAHREGLSMREAAEEWERVTGKSATDAGCPCCGQPHNFTEYDDDGKYVASGPSTSYEASW